MQVRNNTNGNLGFSANHKEKGEKDVPHSILLISGAVLTLDDSVWLDHYAPQKEIVHAVDIEAITILKAPAMSVEVELEAAAKAMEIAEKAMEAAAQRKAKAVKEDKDK